MNKQKFGAADGGVEDFVLRLAVQYACAGSTTLPPRPRIRRWVKAALESGADVTIRIVDEDEGRDLNREFRGKDYATNVLSFPYSSAPAMAGDIVICRQVVEREAGEQGKSVDAHFAHLVVHGMLHLFGYDHELGAAEAESMENKEKIILHKLGFADPYA